MSETTAPNPEKIPARLLAAIVATGLMTFSGVVGETAMNVTFPTLMKEFSVGTSAVQWLTTGYLLVLALIVPLSTFLKKNLCHQNFVRFCQHYFHYRHAHGALAPNFAALLAARLLQGAGTGIALPLMYNIILAQAPKSRIGLIMGIASLVVSMAPAVGPVMSGVVVERFGWHMVFWVLMPLLALSLALGLWGIRPIGELSENKVDWGGYLLLAAGFSAFIFATEKASEYGWLGGAVIGLLAVSAVALALFARRSLASAAPLVNLRVFADKPFSFGLVFILLIQFCVLALGYLIPNYSQLATGNSVSVAGMLLLPGCLIGAFIAPVSGTVYDRIGAAKPILGGALVIIIALAAFAVLGQSLTTALFMGIYAAYCAGQGFSVGNTTTHTLAAVPAAYSADGNAVLNTLQQLAGAVGTAAASTFVASAQNALPGNIAQATKNGTQNAFVLLTALASVAAVCAYLALKHGKRLSENSGGQQ